MRAAIAILACALGLITTGATAGAIHVLRTGGESAPIVSRAWAVKLTVRPATFRGVVQVTATGQGRVDARAVRGAGGTYRARLVFPRTGRWTLTARAGGARSSLGSVTVRPAPPLTLDEPTGIDVAPDGSLLVVEFGLHRLVRVAPTTGRVTVVATLGKPWGVARAPSGTVFASDAGSLMRLDPGNAPTAVAAVEPGLRGIDVATDGTVYVGAADEHRIVRFDSSGQRLGVVGPALGDPYAIAVAGDGTIYAPEPGPNGVIHRITPDGMSSVVVR